jgi:hypothetical protein
MPLRLIYLVRPLGRQRLGQICRALTSTCSHPQLGPRSFSEIEEGEEVTGCTDNRTKAGVAGVRCIECFATWRVVADRKVGMGANQTVKQRRDKIS